jgi:predicted component of type VI protein secretion system
VDGKSLGYLKKDYLDHANSGKSRKFDVFFELLENYEKNMKWEEPAPWSEYPKEIETEEEEDNDTPDVVPDSKPKKRSKKA